MKLQETPLKRLLLLPCGLHAMTLAWSSVGSDEMQSAWILHWYAYKLRKRVVCQLGLYCFRRCTILEAQDSVKHRMKFFRAEIWDLSSHHSTRIWWFTVYELPWNCNPSSLMAQRTCKPRGWSSHSHYLVPSLLYLQRRGRRRAGEMRWREGKMARGVFTCHMQGKMFLMRIWEGRASWICPVVIMSLVSLHAQLSLVNLGHRHAHPTLQPRIVSQ